MGILKSNPERIAQALRVHVFSSVEFNWPKIEAWMEKLGVLTVNSAIAMLATVAKETAFTFQPIKEYGSVAYFTSRYENRTDLGNRLRGDGAKFCGRGFIQITGRRQYERYGIAETPDEALNPEKAAFLAADYFFQHKVYLAAQAGQRIADVHELMKLTPEAKKDPWLRCRYLVDGGYNGLQDFLECVQRLQIAEGLFTATDAKEEQGGSNCDAQTA